MNFELISPVGADVDPMPMTRPDQTTGTSVSTPTPRRHVHRLLLPHCIIHFGTRLQYTDDPLDRKQDLLVAGTRALFFSCSGILLFFFLYLFPSFFASLIVACVFTICSFYQRTTIHFTATYATQHIITITIPNAAGCGR